ncbi:GNAT family N-acetyltransferase [Clostridium paraputrificum]|uniref:GNAT family N-acetyltransferase n=1 Tax=Clostridium TaxID=1485 RepID=UPI00189FCBC4|nr:MULTISPECIES: GNAT family N-acetyltransferase [Clostridium]MDB2076083.1 GNAT family N-acetyltransferase [Clostridium paraputrificum]MDB2079459.1 GNAT family N-acetyltransferase [Clostridium paraputrificum]MDB2084384.1 GNAT family N-acetyltransferase [Clostridium paraputrificum]MDB2098874.1 GNAT family N-acetyltransferase [Clostridium paraputrificum]MDU5739562.1 GNAT family N-acetyltransferase [Clostridium sp.]
MIREVKLSDAKAIVDIYNYYILNTNITFEEKQLTVDDMEERIIEKTAKHPWIVYERDGQVIGYAYLSGWHSRSAYRYSNEASIYLDSNEKGHGIGKELFGQLLEVSKCYGVHTIVSGITIPNTESISLHEKFGFKKIAEFEEIGFKNNKWLNVGYWQKLL